MLAPKQTLAIPVRCLGETRCALGTLPPVMEHRDRRVVAHLVPGLADAQARAVEPAHTETNYLQREMGFVIARRHARKLRLVAEALAFALPAALTLASLALPQAAGTAALTLAAVAMTAGLMVQRWLFFAEAMHTVTLYYGAERA